MDIKKMITRTTNRQQGKCQSNDIEAGDFLEDLRAQILHDTMGKQDLYTFFRDIPEPVEHK